jgi:hypothetical protein
LGNEKNFENKIKTYVRGKGCECEKNFGCNFSTAGRPDLEVYTPNGYTIFIEVKAQNGKPSELQMHYMKKLRKLNQFCYVVYPSGWNKLKDIIDGILEDKFNKDSEVILK